MCETGVFCRARRLARFFLLSGFVAAFMQMQVFAASSVSLAWGWSADPNVIGYNIYYGVVSQTYTNKISVGNVTNAIVSNLVEGTTYFFVVTAYNTVGLESPPSN
jgi:hypothetical protein